MPVRRYESVVIGVGTIGVAACRVLAGRGCRVLGIEQFGLAHDRGSAHGRSRIFRIGYYEHPDYVPLLRRAQEAWRALEREAEITLLLPTGGLWIGPRQSELIDGTLRSAVQHGLDHELLDAGEMRHRWPHLHVDDDLVGFFEPDAGMILPERAITSAAALARRDGATIHEHERVSNWEATSTCVRVETDRDRYEADHLLICGGAWSARLLGDGVFDLTVTRQPAVWFEVRDTRPFRCEDHPCWAVVRNEAGFFYGFPLREPERSMKVSLHEVGAAADPDSIDRHVRDDEIELLRDFLDRTFPGSFGDVTDTSVCMYTNSADGHFIVDRHPDFRERVTVACGFSGHGFKFMPILGEALADLVLDGKTSLPIAFLGAQRFREGGLRTTHEF